MYKRQDIYGWKAKTYTSGLQVNSTLYLSRSGTHGLSLNYNNATGGSINQSVGFLNIQCPGGLPIYYNAYQHQFRSPPGKDFLIINNSNDQAVHLYQNDVLRFSTTSSGVNVVGTTTSTQLAVTGVSTFSGIVAAGIGSPAITLSNSHKITFGSAHELEMFHDGSTSYIKQRGIAYPSRLKIISENSGIDIMLSLIHI